MRSRVAARPRALLAAVVLLLVAAGATAPLRAETADPSTLPAQPGSKAGGCTPKLGAPNSWDQIGETLPVLGNANSESVRTWVPAYRTTPDPWQPCLAYRVPGDARRLERTTDGAKTWGPVFFDGRTSVTGNPMRITGVYAPSRDAVYISEDGNGMAVMRSRDAGATWAPANGGLEGKPVRRVWFAPSNPDVAYALVLTGGAGPAALGAAAEVYATANGGASWTATAARLPQANSSAPTPPFAVAVDPADPAHVYVAYSQGGGPDATPKQGGVILESRDRGASFARPTRLDGELVELLASRRADGTLRLYWLVPQGLAAGIRYSDDNGVKWTEVHVEARFNWLGGLVDPTAADKVLYFGTPYFEAHTGLVALYTRNGFANQELGEQPNAIQTRSYSLSNTTVDRFGQYYIDVGVDCTTERCDPKGAPSNSWLSWRTYRFRPPDPGQALILDPRAGDDPPGTGTFERVHSCDVAARPPTYPGAQDDDGGSLAFDGGTLYYTRRLETGPDDSSAVIRTVDPATCKEAGRLVVHFDPATYADARKRAISDAEGHPLMLPPRPSIDSLSYDPVTDELWFSVSRVAPSLPPFSGDRSNAPFPLWSVPRAGSGPDRQARLRFWTQPCASGGVGLLANDRQRGTLWTCDGKLPGEVTTAGRSLPVCLHPLFSGSQAKGDVWQVQAWGVSRPGWLMVARTNDAGVPNRRLEQFDARTCRHTATWSVPVTEYFPPPRGPEFLSLQIVCDATTYREAGAPDAVAWMRHGPTFMSFQATSLLCPSPTALAYSGGSQVQPGHRLDACATATVPGPAAPLPRATVRISVAGGALRPAVTDAGGRACVPYDVPVDAAQGTRLVIKADVAGDAHLLASAVTGSVLVGAVPVPPPLIIVAPPPAPAPPPIPFPPAPAPAPAPQPGVQPAASPPGQAVSQQGLASEKEREVQLAHAQQESSGEEAASAAEPAAEPVSDSDDSYAFVAVLAGALALGALALGRVAGLGRGLAPSYSTVFAATGSRRTRRGQRRP
jgi:hypothetical protein